MAETLVCTQIDIRSSVHMPIDHLVQFELLPSCRSPHLDQCLGPDGKHRPPVTTRVVEAAGSDAHRMGIFSKVHLWKLLKSLR